MGSHDRIHGLRRTFAALHDEGIFVMPNPWDVGSARILASLGFPAIATTSSGHAASLGKHDQHVARDELLDHVAAISAAVEIPLNVDAERCFADDPFGVSETVALLAGAGAAGCSIEDYDPATGSIDPVDVATARVAAAAAAAHEYGIVLTARAENHLYGAGDLDDTIARLSAYRHAGADVVYAPLLVDPADISRVVAEMGAPVNVLAVPGVPSVAELGEIGVRRVSTGGALAWAAYGALHRAGRELLDAGTSTYLADSLSRAARAAAFGA
jgi:2-methylisocitrate lyase-like PEP mutase family enzyme